MLFYILVILFAFDVFIIACFRNKTVAFATNCEKIRIILIYKITSIIDIIECIVFDEI